MNDTWPWSQQWVQVEITLSMQTVAQTPPKSKTT